MVRDAVAAQADRGAPFTHGRDANASVSAMGKVDGRPNDLAI